MPPRLLARYLEKPRPCSYLAAESASLETRLMVDVEPAELEAMLERGWRRFGPSYFRPEAPYAWNAQRNWRDTWEDDGVKVHSYTLR